MVLKKTSHPPDFDIMDDDEQNVHNNAAMEMTMAYVLLKNSDAKIFGDAFEDISKSYAYGTKQWPETVNAACN
jgi:hypothetical protein